MEQENLEIQTEEVSLAELQIEYYLKHRYRMALWKWVKSMLLTALVVGIIGCAVVVTILILATEETPATVFLTGEGLLNVLIVFGTFAFWGMVISFFIAKDDASEVEVTSGVHMYNTYVLVHNLFVFSSINFGGGIVLSVAALIIRAFVFVYKAVTAVALTPISFIYLCIMSIFEAIFGKINVKLGNFLDKFTVFLARIVGIIVAVLAYLWFVSLFTDSANARKPQ